MGTPARPGHQTWLGPGNALSALCADPQMQLQPSSMDSDRDASRSTMRGYPRYFVAVLALAFVVGPLLLAAAGGWPAAATWSASSAPDSESWRWACSDS